MTIKDCENCGGTHYGSIRCPYLETEMAKPNDAVAVVENTHGDQEDRWGRMTRENERLRAALKSLLDDLGNNDQDGLTIFSETMARAHAALRPLT